MTTQTTTIVGWRRTVAAAVAGGAVAAGLVLGSAPAWAEPTTEAASPEDTTSAAGDAAAAPRPQTADEVLAIIARDYDTGAGGGQLSNLIHDVLKLRSLGFMPSQSNREAIVDALDKRPNQAPLIKALEATYSYQLRNQARGAAQPQQPTTIGINQYPPGYTQQPPGVPADRDDQEGIYIAPGGGPAGPGTINIPLG